MIRLKSASEFWHLRRGFTLVEMLIAMGITTAVTGALLALVNPAQGTFQAQQEVVDLQQRVRVGVDALTQQLIMAGAGTHSGANAGSLAGSFAPVMPYRRGFSDDDPKQGVFYRPDAISVLYVLWASAQTTTRERLPRDARMMTVEQQPNCPPPTDSAVCGIQVGMRALLFDSSGASDVVAITGVVGGALSFDVNGELSAAFEAKSTVARAEMHTYYLSTDAARNISQLRHYDGFKTDLPVLDHVVALRFEYFADAHPPQLLTDRVAVEPDGPWTSYGPRPPAIGRDNVNDTWGPGENCTFLVRQERHIPRLPALAAGVGLVRLDPEAMVDGPWCPDEARFNRFDADLLRIRRIRVYLRVQVISAVLRGPAGLLFMRGGTSNIPERFVPDQEIRFDAAPRNMNLAR
jgi:prepilin-type N-terminal cleavage/methylation domain-containing protein